jgi:hypothetical protein
VHVPQRVLARRIGQRLVNAGVLSYLNFWIEGHNLTVIEADGRPVEPFEVGNIDVNIAERYSVLVRMDQPAGVYPIHVTVKYRNWRQGKAVLVYKGADKASPSHQGYSNANFVLQEGLSVATFSPSQQGFGNATSSPSQQELVNATSSSPHQELVNATKTIAAGIVNLSMIMGIDSLPSDMAVHDAELVLDSFQVPGHQDDQQQQSTSKLT